MKKVKFVMSECERNYGQNELICFKKLVKKSNNIRIFNGSSISPTTIDYLTGFNNVGFAIAKTQLASKCCFEVERRNRTNFQEKVKFKIIVWIPNKNLNFL